METIMNLLEECDNATFFSHTNVAKHSKTFLGVRMVLGLYSNFIVTL